MEESKACQRRRLASGPDPVVEVQQRLHYGKGQGGTAVALGIVNDKKAGQNCVPEKIAAAALGIRP